MLVINLQNYLLPLAAKPLGCNFTKKNPPAFVDGIRIQRCQIPCDALNLN